MESLGGYDMDRKAPENDFVSQRGSQDEAESGDKCVCCCFPDESGDIVFVAEIQFMQFALNVMIRTTV